MILVGTDDGLHELSGSMQFPQGRIDAIAIRDGEHWVVLNERVVAHHNEELSMYGVGVHRAWCVLPTASGVLVGTAEAHLRRLNDSAGANPVPSFEAVPGRDGWYTPWGGPPDVRSISEAADGTLHVNVHVGGIPRSRDGGKTWEPTVDIDADVHQVLAHPTDPNLILAAAAVGLCVSRDGGDAYRTMTDGLHSTYSRAVAIAGETVLATACNGPGGGGAAVYRAPLSLDRPFEKLGKGLPEWFDHNIDTGCLAAKDDLVAFGTADGEVFVSEDAGSTWDRAVEGLPTVRAVAID